MAVARKHTGVVASTGSRIYLVFREIPNDEEYCLVVMADALPDKIAQGMDSLVVSREAQNEIDLYRVLERHRFSDGQVVLNSLHERKLLVKLPVSAINMTPFDDRTIGLTELNGYLNAEINGVAVDTTVEAEAPVAETPAAKSAYKVEEVAERVVEGAVIARDITTDELLGLTKKKKAMLYMDKYRDLKALSEEYKEKAISIDPDCAPRKGRRPSPATEEEKKEARNAKRRKAYAKETTKPKAKAKAKAKAKPKAK